MKGPQESDSNGVQNALQMDFLGHGAIDEAVQQFVVTPLDVVHLDHSSNEQLNHQRGGVVSVVSADFRLHLSVLGFDPGFELDNAVLNRWVATIKHVIVVEEVELKNRCKQMQAKRKDISVLFLIETTRLSETERPTK